MQTVLLTLGRLPVALDIARSFDQAGWRVVIAEPFGMHLSRMSRAVHCCYRVPAPRDGVGAYLDALRDIIKAESVGLIVPVFEESIAVAGLEGALGPEVRYFGVDQTRMLELHDKYRFNRLARRLGLGVPPSAIAGTAGGRALSGERFISKRRYSCGGTGTTLHEPETALPADDSVMLQAYLTGPVLSTFSIVSDGRVSGTVVYRGAVLSGSVAVCFERVDGQEAIQAWVEEFARQTRHTGFLAFDFILDADGRPVALECNPRATSGIHFVDTAAIARAIVDGKELALRNDDLMTESYSCYTAALGKLFGKGSFTHTMKLLFRARDVTWSTRDPWPFLLMMVNTWKTIALAVVKRRTFAAVVALDIEWRGNPEPCGDDDRAGS